MAPMDENYFNTTIYDKLNSLSEGDGYTKADYLEMHRTCGHIIKSSRATPENVMVLKKTEMEFIYKDYTKE